MTYEIVVVFLILAVSVVLFATEKVRTDVVGVIVMATLGIAGVLKPKELLAGFGNEAVVTIAAMFVLSQALMKTGVVNALGAKLADLSKGSPFRFLLFALLTTCFLSAFINNTPVVVVFIPAVLTVCTKLGSSPSKFLMPISFASMLGGSCTLIGTSSNILIATLAEEAGAGTLGMFTFAKVGIFLVVGGMIYLLVLSLKFLPERVTIASSMPAEQVKEYVTQVRVTEGSKLVGKSLGELQIAKKAGMSVVELIRGERIMRLNKKEPLEVNDILLVRGELNKILELDREHEISIAPEMARAEGTVKSVEMTIIELMIAPDSRLIGQKCNDLNMREEYNASIFAIQRKGRHHQRDVSGLELRMGDILLVRVPMNKIEKLRDHDDNFVVLEGVHDQVVEKHNAPIAIATILSIVFFAAFEILPISVLSLAGVAIIVVTGLLTAREAYRSIEWPVLMLIAGMISLGKAMDTTGAIGLVADGLLSIVGGFGPHVTLWLFYVMVAGLSLLIMNKPAAALCTPLAVALATQLSVNPQPFVMAVVFATATALATPMGYQTNLLVYGPGGYTYKDFVKFGLPLNILLAVIASVLIPFVWPF